MKRAGVTIRYASPFLFTLRTTPSRRIRRESKNGSSLGRLVELGGVEPPSESVLQGDSPGADGCFHSLTRTLSRQASGFGSFMMHGAGKAYRTHGPHLKLHPVPARGPSGWDGRP